MARAPSVPDSFPGVVPLPAQRPPEKARARPEPSEVPSPGPWAPAPEAALMGPSPCLPWGPHLPPPHPTSGFTPSLPCGDFHSWGSAQRTRASGPGVPVAASPTLTWCRGRDGSPGRIGGGPGRRALALQLPRRWPEFLPLGGRVPLVHSVYDCVSETNQHGSVGVVFSSSGQSWGLPACPCPASPVPTLWSRNSHPLRTMTLTHGAWLSPRQAGLPEAALQTRPL